MKHRTFFAAACAVIVLTVTLGCSSLDERQRAWIFQPSDRSWGGAAAMAQDMTDVWIDFESQATHAPARLHGLWLPADRETTGAPDRQ
jgi:hypothetical protein